MKIRDVAKEFLPYTVILLLMTVGCIPSISATTEEYERHITLLEWKGPHEGYEEYLMDREILSFSVHQCNRILGRLDDPLVIIFVESSLIIHIENEITVYNSTLRSLGYNTVILEISGGTTEDLKDEILFYYDSGYNVTSAVLVGDLPVAWFYHEWDFDYTGDGLGDPSDFPCDLYLMDLDGEWIDTDADGMYDSHIDGAGDTAPEIFIGRIDASKIPGDEVSIIKQYFHKVHEFWMGNILHTDFGLTYTDKDWSTYPDMKYDLGYAYDEMEAIWYPEVSRDDYVANRLLNISYEFIQLACHSWPNGHHFENGGDLASETIRYTHPQALFYNLFCCGTLRFTEYNCVGNAYILGTNSPSLSVVGSTKSGSMLDFRYFYEPLGEGLSFGQAFQDWFDHEYPYSDDPSGYSDVSWFYGMTILGDPTLIPTATLPPSRVYVDDDYDETMYGWGYNYFNTIQEGINAVRENGTVYVSSGFYEENIVVDKTLSLLGEGRDTTIIDGSESGTIILITGDNVIISGFTLQNCGNDPEYAGILVLSHNNVFSENVITTTYHGISLSESSHSTITRNFFMENTVGLILSSLSSDNLIYHNNFLNNSEHASDAGSNNWDNGYPSGGNFWDDYTGSDDNGDGIGDIPYDIPGGSNQDLYPFMEYQGWNIPPAIPLKPSGPSFGYIETNYSFETNTTDADDDQVYYLWDWGDETTSSWCGPYDSGQTMNASHIWTTAGNYNITVKARDIFNDESTWSEEITIRIIEEDDIEPVLEIIKPVPHTLYLANEEVLQFGNKPIIIGLIDIEVNASDDESGMNRVEFYVNNVLKKTDTSKPYVWTWNSFAFFRKVIKVIAYDNVENAMTQELVVWKFF